MTILWNSDTWCSLNRANAFFQFENLLEIKQTSLLLAARRFDFAFCCMQIKHNTESLYSLQYSQGNSRNHLEWNARFCLPQCFFGKLKSAGWNGSVMLISTASLAVDWSTCCWIGEGCDSWLDIVASTSLVKLIVSHILLGGGFFIECKWNIIRPICHMKKWLEKIQL